MKRMFYTNTGKIKEDEYVMKEYLRTCQKCTLQNGEKRENKSVVSFPYKANMCNVCAPIYYAQINNKRVKGIYIETFRKRNDE